MDCRWGEKRRSGEEDVAVEGKRSGDNSMQDTGGIGEVRQRRFSGT